MGGGGEGAGLGGGGALRHPVCAQYSCEKQPVQQLRGAGDTQKQKQR